ncbi:MAG TPA: hypothetical protein VK524_06620 [Polyangiaceae bacterium]|nr:hypothetical protein [Polyangiaceae bacterium]
MPGVHSRAVLFALLGVIFLERAAAAQAESSEGYVVKVDGDDVIVDIAGKKGAAEGDVLELWRPLKLKHPVSGRIVVDRFSIGRLVLKEVRSELALARADGDLEQPPLAGDVVVLHGKIAQSTPEQAPRRPERARASHASASTRMDEAELAVTKLFEALRGADVVTRIRAYEGFVHAHPSSRFSPTLHEEALALRRLLELGSERTRPELVSFAAPESAASGMSLSVALEARDAAGAVLHTRRPGEVAYRTTPMQPLGPGYFGVTLPAERMQHPELEYFVELTGASGAARSVVAGAGHPNQIEIERVPLPLPPLAHESVVSVLTDYADWNRLRGNDVVWQTEGYFGVRFADVGLRAGRTGFGVYRGVGGSLDELDREGKSARRVGLTYGYLEGEYGFTPSASLIARGVIGLDDSGVAGGAQLHVRIGSDRSTNLLLGGEMLGGIGARLITQLELSSWQRVPILFRTEVTNQPAGTRADEDDVRPDEPHAALQDTSLLRGEVGARAIAQVGYRLWPELTIAARGSYQGRTINHAGPGFGGAVTYSW